MCSPSALAKDVAFLVLETVWGIGVGGAALDGCLSTGESLVAEQLEVMGVLVPIEDDMR